VVHATAFQGNPYEDHTLRPMSEYPLGARQPRDRALPRSTRKTEEDQGIRSVDLVQGLAVRWSTSGCSFDLTEEVCRLLEVN